MNAATVLLHLWVGYVATRYDEPYVGGPLYCGGTYTLEAEPWVAVDVGLYESGAICCGDVLLVTTPYGTIRARAIDSGPLLRYNVGGQPILVDIPTHLAPFAPRLSSPVKVVNLSGLSREAGLADTHG